MKNMVCMNCLKTYTAGETEPYALPPAALGKRGTRYRRRPFFARR